MNRMRRRLLILVALLAGLLAAAIGAGQLFITKMPGRSFEGALPPLTDEQTDLSARLETHVRALAGDIGERNLFRYEALLRAAGYIEETFESAGFEPRAQPFEVRGKTVRNIEVEIAGTEPASGIVVIGAHYDSVDGSPGANDNATGVGAVLELARLMRHRTPRRSVRFVTFVNEEPPFFYSDAMGSVRYADRSAKRGENIVAMLSLETIGYYDDRPGSQHYPVPLSLFYGDRGNFIGFVGNLKSRALVRRAVASFRDNARFPSEGLAAPGWLTGVGWSDHWSFWQVGYPAIMVTDTALFRYGEYHTAADRPRVVDFERYARVVDGLAPVIMDLAAGAVP
ncbi:MAG: M28 family peptidase [Gammaproteobacteria bacterium]|nr:M28 family peptidase [Gammaproteobacteria bacterium]